MVSFKVIAVKNQLFVSFMTKGLDYTRGEEIESRFVEVVSREFETLMGEIKKLTPKGFILGVAFPGIVAEAVGKFAIKFNINMYLALFSVAVAWVIDYDKTQDENYPIYETRLQETLVNLNVFEKAMVLYLIRKIKESRFKDISEGLVIYELDMRSILDTLVFNPN
jgi:hypothetical protein